MEDRKSISVIVQVGLQACTNLKAVLLKGVHTGELEVTFISMESDLACSLGPNQKGGCKLSCL